MIKIAVVGITAAVLSVVLRKNTPELALLLCICAGIWAVSAVLGSLEAILATMDELAQIAGLSDELVAPVLKTVALSILTKITVEVCRSSGEGGVAAFVEVAGTVLTVLIALPLVRAVMILMAEILQ